MNQPLPDSDRWTFRRGLFQAVLCAAVMYSSLGGYLVVLKWRGAAASVVTWIPADDWFPFWPGWVWVYLLPYVIAPCLVVLLSRSTFWWFIRDGLILVGLTLCIFIAFPTQTATDHRTKDVGSGITADIYKKMIEIDDPPANAAPSLHVSLTCLLFLALLRDLQSAWPIWLGFLVLVLFSTLVTRQHHLIDVASGAVLAFAIAFLPRIALARRFRTMES